MPGDRANPATPSPRRPVVCRDFCLPFPNLPGRGWVPGGEQGDSTRVGSMQNLPPIFPHPLLTALNVGDRSYSLTKLYSQLEGLPGFIDGLQTRTRQIPAQTPALFQAAETKGCSYIFLEKKATSTELSLKIKRSFHLSLRKHKRAAAGSV